jgi:hypothetical protein
MLRELLTRMPGDDPVPLASNFITGVKSMPVAWG